MSWEHTKQQVHVAVVKGCHHHWQIGGSVDRWIGEAFRILRSRERGLIIITIVINVIIYIMRHAPRAS